MCISDAIKDITAIKDINSDDIKPGGALIYKEKESPCGVCALAPMDTYCVDCKYFDSERFKPWQ